MQGQNQGPRAGKERSAPVDLAPYPNCSNICFLGTNVVSGTATAVVIATGARTYFGSLTVRLRWRYSVDLPLPPRRSADNPAALPSRRDFSLGYDRLARAGHGKPRPVREPTRRVGALGRPAVLSSLSYTTRSLSALMILLFSGLLPERTMLING